MPENQQKKRDAPEFMRKQPKSGAFWVLERMETVGDGCERMGKPGVRTKMHQMTMQHVQKENRRKPSVFADFLAGAEGLVSAAASVGSRQSATGARAPLGKRFWGGCGNSLQGVGKCRCWPVPPQVRKGAGCGRRPSQRAHNPSFWPIQEGYAWGAEIAGNLFHLLPCVAGVNQSFASEYITPVGGLFFQCTRGTILSKS